MPEADYVNDEDVHAHCWYSRNSSKLTIIVYVSVKRRQKTATLGAVFGVLSTAPQHVGLTALNSLGSCAKLSRHFFFLSFSPLICNFLYAEPRPAPPLSIPGIHIGPSLRRASRQYLCMLSPRLRLDAKCLLYEQRKSPLLCYSMLTRWILLSNAR
jgi:hypothetical protein